jgi:hypothetical protein
MKIIRLGMTESGLLLMSYISTLSINDNFKRTFYDLLSSLLNWLCTTSGYYDKSVECEPGKIDIQKVMKTKTFQEFINHLQISVRNCHETQMMFHGGIMMNIFNSVRQQFLSHFGIVNFKLMNGIKLNDRLPFIFSSIKNKRILVVSSFSNLINIQYENNNIYRLGNNFPEIESLCTVTTPYCFLNDGPHHNYIETLNSIFDSIVQQQNHFDIALLGCGCYGHMLTHLIHEKLNKDAFYIGGNITTIFGILSNRERKHVQHTNEYWITNIPDEYKPACYKEIEDGCYW